jgi:hypothetical protein
MRLLYTPDCYSQQRQREKKVNIYPVRLAMEATYHADQGDEVHWEHGSGIYDKVITKEEGVPFELLPAPDRITTRAFDAKYQKYGNYKFHPATHMMVAGGCWHGKCTFCVENGSEYFIRDIDYVLDEIWECEYMGFKEIFDDSATFPTGKWLEDFCSKRKHPEAVMGCNMRIGADVDFKMMKAAGFRMVLFGIESANQSTLDRIKKGIKADDIIPTIKMASDAGLSPHIACMHGYPWESVEEEARTLELVCFLLRKGYAKTAQASIYKTETENGVQRRFNIYRVARSPEFWIRKIGDIKRWEDFTYMLKGIKAAINDNIRYSNI